MKSFLVLKPSYRGAIVVLALAIVVPIYALADDGSLGVMLPAPHSVPSRSIVQSEATITLQAGTVEAALAVAILPADGAAVTLDMPRFSWLGEAEPYPDRQFPELRILVDGAPAKMESSVTDFAGSTDITEIIRAAGVDPFVIADTPPFVTAGPGGEAALEQLQQLGAVIKSGPDLSPGAYFLGRWTAQRHVKVALLQNPHITLTLAYKARPGYRLLQLNRKDVAARLRRYCLDVPKFMELLDRHDEAPITEYAIPAGIDDKSPSTVTVQLGEQGMKERAHEPIAFCGADGKAVIMRTPGTRSSARADGKGIVHILSVDDSEER